MREISYRARRTDNGEWVEGNLVWIKNCNNEPYQCFIISHLAYMEYGEFDDTYQVLPETVGQYTGLLDKDGKKIFEGDIVQSIELELKGVIIFDEYCRFMIKDISTKITYLLARNNEEIKVIGNIHDNKDLLEVKQCPEQ